MFVYTFVNLDLRRFRGWHAVSTDSRWTEAPRTTAMRERESTQGPSPPQLKISPEIWGCRCQQCGFHLCCVFVLRVAGQYWWQSCVVGGWRWRVNDSIDWGETAAKDTKEAGGQWGEAEEAEHVEGGRNEIAEIMPEDLILIRSVDDPEIGDSTYLFIDSLLFICLPTIFHIFQNRRSLVHLWWSSGRPVQHWGAGKLRNPWVQFHRSTRRLHRRFLHESQEDQKHSWWCEHRTWERWDDCKAKTVRAPSTHRVGCKFLVALWGVCAACSHIFFVMRCLSPREVDMEWWWGSSQQNAPLMQYICSWMGCLDHMDFVFLIYVFVWIVQRVSRGYDIAAGSCESVTA